MTLLIDGDILLYESAARCEKVFDWGDDLWSIAADLKEAKGHYLSKVAELEQRLGMGSIVCVSDSAGTFRHDLFDDYKAHRKGRKPLVFRALREWAVEKGALCWPNLEADDVLGILATAGTVTDPIVVTIDKDLMSVPGRHYNQNHADRGVVEVSQQQADEFHLIQTIAGDSTDNYKGVPGMGMIRAKRVLEKEGYSWETVVQVYESNGLTESEALLNARMAKILTADWWDFDEKKVILWEPKGVRV